MDEFSPGSKVKKEDHHLIEHAAVENQPFVFPCLASNNPKDKKRSLNILLGFAIILLLASVFLLYHFYFNPNPVYPAPLVSPTPAEVFTPPASSTPEIPVVSDPEQACIQNNGKWSALYKECEGLNQTACFSLKGNYNECASPCRHNANKNTPCIMMCVQLCSFN